jgi:hypothetical protein
MARDEVSAKPLIEKLGWKPGLQAAALGFENLDWADGAGFDTDLLPAVMYDLIVLRIDERAGLDDLARFRKRIVDRGAMWIAYPKGLKTITEDHVRAAGNEENWTDVKVCKFSESHTGLKFVRRLKPAAV